MTSCVGIDLASPPLIWSLEQRRFDSRKQCVPFDINLTKCQWRGSQWRVHN
jgi:hypothetical protein